MTNRIGRRPVERDLVTGQRLRLVNGLHPGEVIEVVSRTAVNVAYRYVRRGRGKDDMRRYSARVDWVMSHTEVVQ